MDCEDKFGFNWDALVTELENLEELVEKLRVVAPKADEAWLDYRQ